MTHEELLAELDIHDEIMTVYREDLRACGMPTLGPSDDETAAILAPVANAAHPRARIVTRAA